MIQVEMSKDIRDYTPKVIGIFDKRQILFLGASCIYGIPIMMFAKSIPFEIRLVVAVVLMLPVAACGWVKMYDMPLEQFIIHLITTKYMLSSKRPYVTENTFNYIDPEPAVTKKISTIKPEKLRGKAKKKRKRHLIKYGAVE